MLPVSATFLEALASSQQVSTRADLLKAGAVVYSGLPVTGGQVSFTRSSIASRSVSCTIAPELPLADYAVERSLTGGTLGVYGHELRIYWSLHLVGGGVESLPLGRFRIDSMAGSLSGDGEVSLSGVSREAFVADEKFVVPRTVSGPSARSLIAALIVEALAGAEVVMSATRDAAVPATTFEGGRWDAIKTLADSIAATVRCDAYGRFVVTDAPTTDSSAVWTAKAGPGGVIVRASGALDRSRVRNCWIVQGSPPDGQSVPVQAVVYDEAPGSPTRYGDPDAGFFGRVPEVRQVSTLSSLDQCRELALSLLAQTCGAASSIDLGMVPNPALEVGDVIDIMPDADNLMGSRRRHIIDSGSMDLTPGGAFTLATRDLMQVADA